MQEDQALKKAIDEWDRVSQDPEVLLAYEARRKTLLDELSALRRAEKQGEKKGVMKVALGMIHKGMDNETIAELTELTKEEIEQLRRQ